MRPGSGAMMNTNSGEAEAEGVDPWTRHAGIDRRVLAMTRVIVAKIDRDPALVRIGLENIERWTRQNKGYLPRCHAEWKELIETHSWERLREILLQEYDEGQRLRSSHPFTGILTQDERDAIYARHGIDLPRMRREDEERTGRPWPTTTEMVLEQFGTADQRPGDRTERGPKADGGGLCVTRMCEKGQQERIEDGWNREPPSAGQMQG